MIHQLTALPPRIDPRKIERDFALNDRLRSEGTRILVRRRAGGRRRADRSRRASPSPTPRARPARVHDESDPLDRANRAEAVQALGGRARGARAHGARRRRASCCATATSTAPAARSRATARSRKDVAPPAPADRRRRRAACGRSSTSTTPPRDGRGARRDGASGAYNVVDDEPAPVRAVAAGARRRARRAAPAARAGAARAPARRQLRRRDDDRGAGRLATTLAKRELGWQPELPELARGLPRRRSAEPRRRATATCARPARRRPPAAPARRCAAHRCAGVAIPSRPKRSITTEIASWPGDHDGGQAARAERAHGDERDGHVDRAEQPADERPPRRPPDVAERRRGRRSTNDGDRRAARPCRRGTRSVAACTLPTRLPSRALIGACMPDQAARADAEQHRQPAAHRLPRGSLRLQPVRARRRRRRRAAARALPHAAHLALDQLARRRRPPRAALRTAARRGS